MEVKIIHKSQTNKIEHNFFPIICFLEKSIYLN